MFWVAFVAVRAYFCVMEKKKLSKYVKSEGAVPVTEEMISEHMSLVEREGRDRLLRRRESLFSVEEVAELMGVPVSVVEELERSFLTTDQRRYLNVLRYNFGLYPVRKKRVRALLSSGEVAIVSPRGVDEDIE